MKAVIHYVHREDFVSGERRLRARNIVRIVKNIRVCKKISNDNQRQFHNTQHEEYKDVTWTLYQGSARIDGDEYMVYGWSINDNVPLYWACDLVDEESDLHCLWSWICRPDLPEIHKVVRIATQPAAERIRRYLGKEALDNYLGG